MVIASDTLPFRTEGRSTFRVGATNREDRRPSQEARPQAMAAGTITPHAGGPITSVRRIIAFSPSDRGPVSACLTRIQRRLSAIRSLTRRSRVTAPGRTHGDRAGAAADWRAVSMSGKDLPCIVLNLDHQVANLKMEVIDVATIQSLNMPRLSPRAMALSTRSGTAASDTSR
jgi:hypothetical protein